MVVVCWVLNLFLLVLLIRVILSWVPSLPEPIEPFARVMRAITDPVLVPLRGVIPPVRMGGAALDLSPIIIFVGLSIVIALIC